MQSLGRHYVDKNPSQIDLNFFEIELDSQEISLSNTEYVDENKLKCLRKENPDYFFQRDDEEIFAWPLKSSVPPFDFSSSNKSVRFSDKSYLFAKIVQTGAENFLRSIGLKFVGRKPFMPDFIKTEDLCPDIPGIALYSKLTLQAQVLGFSDNAKLGFLINFGSHVVFIDSVAELINKGIDPRAMLIKNNGYISKILRVSGSKITLDDGEVVDSKSVKPVATRRNQLHYLSSIGEVEAFQQKLDTENQPSTIYSKIQSTYQFLRKNKGKMYLGGVLTIKNILNFAVSSSSNHFRKSILYRPTHYFKNNQPETLKRTSDALAQQGPFSDKPKKLKMLVLSSEEHKGNTELFLKKLVARLQALFHFEEIDVDDRYFPKTDLPLEGYQNLLYQNDINIPDYDIAVIIIREEYRELPTHKNPYFVLKALLMGDKLPSQEVEIETVRQMGRGAEIYILNNISLAIFGKIGGTPWAVEKLDPIRKEFIIGVGGSIIKDNNKERKQIIGFATVFDWTGRYIVGECSTVTTTDNYRQILKEHLKQLISKLIENENIQPGQEIRFIFHLFKPAGKYNELWAIQEALQIYTDYTIEYAILHLNRGHNFRIFANSGKELPLRGLLVDVSDNKKLLYFASSFLHKRLRGNPAPLLVVLDNRSSFRDLDYLIKQVFYFSFLSCRSFIPSKTPITIMYPSLLAFLSGKLKEIHDWDYRKLEIVKDKLWFL